jgi:hypothetical protein
MAITLGTTSPPGVGGFGFSTGGDIWTTAYTLTGAGAGATFTEIRVRAKNNHATVPLRVRGVVYDNSGNLVDWGSYTLPGGSAEQVVALPLTAAAADGTYKIGIQGEHSFVSYWMSTSGVTTTTYFTDSGGISFGSAPPNPWTPGASHANWQIGAAVDVSAAAAPTFVPQITIL